jgi:hypothetical protein
MHQSIQIKTGGQRTGEECMWMNKKVSESMCTLWSRRSEHSGGVHMDAPESEHGYIAEWRSAHGCTGGMSQNREMVYNLPQLLSNYRQDIYTIW